MICSFCLSTILTEGSEWTPHHPHATSWAVSLLAPGRCRVCWKMWSMLSMSLKGNVSKPQLADYKTTTSLEAAITSVVDCWPKFATRLERQGPDFWVSTLLYTIQQGQPRPDTCHLQIFVLQPLGYEHLSPKQRQSLGSDHRNSSSRQPDLSGVGSTIDCAIEWLQECNTEHAQCRAFVQKQKERLETKSFTPTRLLDVGTAEDSGLRLVEMGGEERAFERYMTLSHCWGDPKLYMPLRLLRDNAEEFHRRIEYDSLPLTFRESVDVCKALGVRYLWIDCLCIIQDDNAEWIKEAGKMHLIYRNSYCNIAAGNSLDARGGIMRYQRPAWLSPETVPFRGRFYKLTTPTYHETETSNGTLARRAWIQQERLLSPRVLHFGTDQVFWQCPSLTACEGAPCGLVVPELETIFSIRTGRLRPGTSILLQIPPRLYDHNERQWRRALHQGELDTVLTPEDLKIFDWYSIWQSIVKDYSMCDLTYPTDKLTALSSVASVFQQPFAGVYLAGLWGSRSPGVPWFIHQLAWEASGKDNRRSRRYSEYCGPSWSWASVDGAIEIISSPYCFTNEMAFAPSELPLVTRDVVDSEVPTGKVGNACAISLRGHLMNIPRQHPKSLKSKAKSSKSETNAYSHMNDHVSWRLSFDDPRDDQCESKDADQGQEGICNGHDYNLIVLLLGLVYTRECFAYGSELEDASWTQQPPPTDKPQDIQRCVVSTASVSTEEGDGKSYRLVVKTPRSSKGLKDGMKELKGHGLILKPVPDRAGYFTRIGLLTFEPIDEGSLWKVRRMLIRDKMAFGPDAAYDWCTGHKITLI